MCEEKCQHMAQVLGKEKIPFQLWEINPTISPTTAYKSYDVLIDVLKIVSPPDKPSLPIALYFDDKDYVKAVSISVVDPEKVVSIYKKAMVGNTYYLYTGSGTYTLSATQINSIEKSIAEFAAMPKPKLATLEDIYNDIKSMQMESATHIPYTGFVVLGTTSCPYTRGMYYWLKKEYEELTKTVLGKEAQSIPFVVGIKNGKVNIAFLGYQPIQKVEDAFRRYDTLHVLSDGQFVKAENVSEKDIRNILRAIVKKGH